MFKDFLKYHNFSEIQNKFNKVEEKYSLNISFYVLKINLRSPWWKIDFNQND